MTKEDLLKKAIEARKYAYIPYSHFGVGAALLTKSGKVFCGCNIENSAFGFTICAEDISVYTLDQLLPLRFDL